MSRRELIGSQQAARVIHHRPNMEIPMCVHPANHTHPTGPNLLCHVLAFRRLPTIPSPGPGQSGWTEHSRSRTRRLLMGVHHFCRFVWEGVVVELPVR